MTAAIIAAVGLAIAFVLALVVGQLERIRKELELLRVWLTHSDEDVEEEEPTV